MSVAIAPAPFLHGAPAHAGYYHTADTMQRMVVATPDQEPELWAEYLDGALTSYRRYGVAEALEYDTVRDGHTTALFFAALDDAGAVIGGVRVQGPHGIPADSHVMVEWAGRDGEADLAKMISDRIPFGLVEMKAAWVSPTVRDKAALALAVGRTTMHAMSLLGAQFAIASSAEHSLAQWKAIGGSIAQAIPATPYPTDQYRTRVMFWDRRTFTAAADAAQIPLILSELMELSGTMTGGTRRRSLRVVGA